MAYACRKVMTVKSCGSVLARNNYLLIFCSLFLRVTDSALIKSAHEIVFRTRPRTQMYWPASSAIVVQDHVRYSKALSALFTLRLTLVVDLSRTDEPTSFQCGPHPLCTPFVLLGDCSFDILHWCRTDSKLQASDDSVDYVQCLLDSRTMCINI